MILIDQRKHLFREFLAEANAVGSGFEQKTADMVSKWLVKNNLASKYSAKRFQQLSEDDGSRDEDFSDVVVEERKTGSKFFIECKEFERSNVLNLQFDIKADGQLIPVAGKKRTALDEAETERVSGLVKSIKGCGGYSDFIDFLNTRNKFIKNLRPADFWSDTECEDAKRFLPSLISAYNKLVKSGKVEADCKEFDVKKLRDSTLNQLVCALCWRLSDPDNRTWDICKIDDIPDFGKLVRRHYSDGKAKSAKYIQFGDDKLFRTSDDNPLNLADVPIFPADIDGEFTLKFTPRFGTGSIYVTPRSEITSDLVSNYSFINKEKWPKTCH